MWQTKKELITQLWTHEPFNNLTTSKSDPFHEIVHKNQYNFILNWKASRSLFFFFNPIGNHQGSLMDQYKYKHVPLTNSHKLYERNCEILLVAVCLLAFIIDVIHSETKNRQQRHNSETVIEFNQAGKFRPWFYLKEEQKEFQINFKCSCFGHSRSIMIS